MRVNSCPALYQTPETTSDSFIQLLKKTFDREATVFLQAVAASSVTADKTVRAPSANDRATERQVQTTETAKRKNTRRNTVRLGNEPAAISIRQVPWTSFLNISIGLFAFLQKERYIFVFNLVIVSLGLPLPLRGPP